MRFAETLARYVAKFLLLTFILTACGTGLWGSYEPDVTIDPGATESNGHASVSVTATSIAAGTELSASPTATHAYIPSTSPVETSAPAILYETQSGDSLEVVALHYGVRSEEITSSQSLPETGLIPPGTILVIPSKLAGIPQSPNERILPDSEIIYGPSAADFDISGYVMDAGGFLSDYTEYLAIPGWVSGAGSIERLAFESSINPRLLLAFLQYKSGWVLGEPYSESNPAYPLGYDNYFYQGLYQQLRLLVRDIDAGYYGWRSGTLTDLVFPEGKTIRISPGLNAGTVAIQYLFSLHLKYEDWSEAISSHGEFLTLYNEMFGNSWARAALVEPLFPHGIIQPEFSLPFDVGYPWSYTGGPHAAWEQESALAALDFAPAMPEPGCGETNAWVVAIAPGLIVRSGGGYVILDLDGDGFEQTGWVILYMHIATKDRIQAGTWVDAGDHIGHPSCEGGIATGTHVHIARKYNGEWVGAGGALPFIMSGWSAHQGAAPYYGTLTKGDRIIISSKTATYESHIIRQEDE